MSESGYNDLDLLNLDKDGKPPKESRIKNAASVVSVYNTLKMADEKRAINRARVQSMFDGAPPYDQNLLVSTGQGSRTNLNWGESQRFLDVASAGYVDLESSLQTLVNVVNDSVESGDRARVETVIAEEATRAFRAWPEWHSNYLRIVNQFIIHGVGVALFSDKDDWRYCVKGFGDFLIPQQTSATEAAIEIGCAYQEYRVDQLYNYIRNAQDAEEAGWNIEALKKAMCLATTGARSQSNLGNWEELENELKNNDLYSGMRNTHVATIHALVREFDGTISHFIVAENSESKDFLFKSISCYDSPEQAFLFFTAGVGTNGTYHSIRGLGQKIFSHIQVSNRLRSQAVDGAMLASSIMIQPESQRALDELSLAYYGPYAVLSPNAKITEKGIPNMSQSVMPVIADVADQMNRNLDFFSNTGAAGGSPYRSRLQVEAELEAATRLTSANLGLFYTSWTRLLRQMTERLIKGERSDKAVADFYKRCEQRNVSADVVRKTDFAKTIAVRAIGAGNASARTAALNEVEQLMPLLSEDGKKNLVFDRIAARVGYDNADRYAQPASEPLPNTETKMAILENTQLLTAVPIEVLSTEMHQTHLEQHIPKLQEIVAAIESGNVDPMTVLDGMMTLHQHVAAHTEYLSQDPTAGAFAAQAREVVNNSGNIVANYLRRRQSEERKMAQAQSANPESVNGAPQQPSAEEQLKLRMQEMKLQEIQLRMQLAQVGAENKQAMERQKFEQELALRDAAAFGKLNA